jgi:hypothetical protein
MRARAGFACAALVTTGCFFPGQVSRDAHSAAYGVDGLLAAAGVATLVAFATNQNNDDMLEWDHNLEAAAVGIVAAAGLGILINWHMPAPELPPPPPAHHADPTRIALMRSWSPPVVDGADPQLVRADGLARAAAAYDDCATATTLMAQIKTNAPRYYEAAVVPDPLLALCAP